MKCFKRFVTVGMALAAFIFVFNTFEMPVEAKQKVLKQVVEFDPASQQPTGYLEFNINVPVNQLQFALLGHSLAFVSIGDNSVMNFGIDEGFSYEVIPVNAAPNVPSIYLTTYVYGEQYTDVINQANKSYVYTDDAWTLDSAGNPVQLVYTDVNNVPWLTVNCKYDEAGRIIEYNLLYQDEQERHDTKKYIAYDEAGRLQSVIASYDDRNGDETYVGTALYTTRYDADGFMTDYVYESSEWIYAYHFIYE